MAASNPNPNRPTPTLAEIMQRLEALEARTLSARDLPLGELRKWLEKAWEPDANNFLLRGSIGNAVMGTDSVNNRTLAANAVATAEILNDAVTLAKLATDVEQEFAHVGPAGVIRNINGGVATMNFPNSNTATDLAVTHNLGATPIAVVATGAYAPFGQQHFSTTTYGSTQFTLEATSSLVLNQNVNVAWIAWG